jgi:hypothetical protein
VRSRLAGAVPVSATLGNFMASTVTAGTHRPHEHNASAGLVVITCFSRRSRTPGRLLRVRPGVCTARAGGSGGI